jgi:hypothetical protein
MQIYKICKYTKYANIQNMQIYKICKYTKYANIQNMQIYKLLILHVHGDP